ncbi:DEAD/DEAH box helicase family protein [Microbulbifer salipaludis]|uniref:DEAD/DEAH box helicase family protein n=1 Tax=Microbulbifer salipaludis TaxID=187980 RepID=A0ABS3E860_9GAMM|nr:DEAD/DEAH box helicase family protein [Microbulbifer salipaludis]MBN8431447.1 DEAD/DEAH box helicase family protein [Microbulbifer salipaludis]
MNLRLWQAECISLAYEQYCSNIRHFMCLATPGAGKTVMASVLAKRLFDMGMIDMVMCFSPSILVADDFRKELEAQTGRRLTGQLGAHGFSITYQSMSSMSPDFWEILENFRVFVIFDEIHHCAATEVGKSNSWGETIHRYIRGKTAYTLALTGTPWRSDSIPIVLADYCKNSGSVQCDFRYGLAAAIADEVCRTPRITAVDNSQICVTAGQESYRYSSFRELLSQSDCSYQDLLDDEVLIIEILRLAAAKLDSLRRKTPNAGGLIVATSVSHARKIARLLYGELNETAEIATYVDEKPMATIRKFRNSSRKWIISVGMISEGTNLPRLKVCCYLTRVKTELYFRQVLGRILRSTGQLGESGYLFMPAEPTLVEYGQRVSEDIPESNILTFEKAVSSVRVDISQDSLCCGDEGEGNTTATEHEMFTFDEALVVSLEPSDSLLTLAESYEACVKISGDFVQRLLEISGAEFEISGNPPAGQLPQ